ncbi:MAG TPA: hypothetical protein O0Y05_03450 [Methanocorpusculum sp.]|nr:hypothetical protein [Methanocorpusculum sp.]
MNKDTGKIGLLFLVASLLVTLTLAGAVSAYSFDFITPNNQTATLKMGVGSQIVVDCVTDNIPAGATMRVVLSKSGGNAIESKSLIIQSDGHFRTIFETWELTGGMYTVTVQEPKDYPFGSKRNWFTVQLIDRTGELTNTAPRIQYSTEEVQVSGKASTTGSRGVELTMYEGDSRDGCIVYGPIWVGTDEKGTFSEIFRATGAGTYQIIVKDKDGYIGLLTYTLMNNSTPSPPTTTSYPTSSGKMISANAEVSSEMPAYFALKTGTGDATITAFRGNDWTIEYIVNNGTIRYVNNKDENEDEIITIPISDAIVHLKVYPTKNGVKGTVYLTAKNVVYFNEDPNIAERFKTCTEPSTPQSQAWTAGSILSILVAAAVLIYSRR